MFAAPATILSAAVTVLAVLVLYYAMFIVGRSGLRALIFSPVSA